MTTRRFSANAAVIELLDYVTHVSHFFSAERSRVNAARTRLMVKLSALYKATWPSRQPVDGHGARFHD